MKARLLIVGLLSAVLLGGTASVLLPAAGSAQAPAPPAPPPPRERPLPGRHIEGRIAFLHAELKITATQQSQWDRVAATMRANAKQMDQLAQEMRAGRDQPQNAVDRLDRRVRFVAARANAEKAFADAFKPLYATLSDDQKKSADDLFARPMHPRGRG
jgi:hypothetical protein